MFKVIVNGAYGKMGSTTCEAIESSKNYQLVARLGRQDVLSAALLERKPDIVIDFTNAHSVYQNTKTLLDQKIKCVIGASGLTSSQLEELTALAEINKTGCIVAPNFSIGAILMIHFSGLAAKYLPEVEIVETHHQQKLDAPSGTAMKTAEVIRQARTQEKNALPCQELHQGARGAEISEVNIHSLRLPGYIASQQVMFGGEGENLTITHNSINRNCFMPGVLLACDKVLELSSLVYGLEHLL